MHGPIFHYHHRVSYSECTLGNHVYYGRYLDILERARGELFQAVGHSMLSLQERGAIFPVLECGIKYKFPARYDDVLDVRLWVTQLDRVRLAFAYRILNPTQKLVLEATTHHVCTSLEEKPQRLPADLAAALQPFVASPAAEP